MPSRGNLETRIVDQFVAVMHRPCGNASRLDHRCTTPHRFIFSSTDENRSAHRSQPPVTLSASPVTNSASFDTRYSTAAATSAPVPGRATAVPAVLCRRAWGTLNSGSSITAGATTFTVIHIGPPLARGPSKTRGSPPSPRRTRTPVRTRARNRRPTELLGGHDRMSRGLCPIADRDVRAGGGQGEPDGLCHPTGSAGDDGYAAGEAQGIRRNAGSSFRVSEVARGIRTTSAENRYGRTAPAGRRRGSRSGG